VSFVVTAGQIQAVQRMPAWSYPSAPLASISLSANFVQTYAELWRTQPALRTVVDFLSRNVAQLGLDPYQRVGTDRIKLYDHPFARLLERPWPGSKWTKYRLLNTLMHDLCIYDNAFLLKVRGEAGDPPRIMPVPVHMVQVTGTNLFFPDSYVIVGNQSTREVAAEDMVHIHGYNGVDPRKGVSAIETLRQILAEEYQASKYREQMWRNGARVGGYVARPKDAPRWSDPARQRFEAQWKALYSGEGDAVAGTPVLEDGMQFVAAGVTPRDAQYVESRKLTREEVAVAYHVSPVMIGLMDGATFSNVTELHKMLYQDTLAPYLTQIAQDLENQLLEDLDPAAADGSIYVEFNLAEKLRGSFAEQATAMMSAVGGPWMTRTEARQTFNLTHIAEADELIVPLNVVNGGLAAPNDTAPNNPSNGSEPKAFALRDVLREFTARQREVLLSKAHRTGGLRFDTARWVKELTTDLWGVAGAGDAAVLAKSWNAATEAKLRVALSGWEPAEAIKNVYADIIEELGSEA
jgi:HK97 family phage portal protein